MQKSKTESLLDLKGRSMYDKTGSVFACKCVYFPFTPE